MKHLLGLLLVLSGSAGAFAAGEGERAEVKLPTFTILNGAETPTLDGSLIENSGSSRIHLALFENLLSYDPKTNDALPGIAESWSVSDDLLTYTFRLRDVTWSDSTPITAETVVDSWLRTLNPTTRSPYAWMMGMIIRGANEYTYGEGEVGPEVVQIRALDTKTFQMDLVRPAAYLPGMLPHSVFGVLPTHVIEQKGDDWTLTHNFVSNGPFLLKERNRNRLVVVRNDEYWDAENVGLGEIVFISSDDDADRYDMYLNGEADWVCGGIPAGQIDVAKNRPDYQASARLATYYLEVNHTKPPFDDVRVRRALAMTINRREIVDDILDGGQIPAVRITPPLPGYAPPDGLSENVSMAQQLLADAGYVDGEGFPAITILYNTSSGHRPIMEHVQARWEHNLGIMVEIKEEEWANVLARGKLQDFDILRMGWVGDYQDADTFLQLFVTGSGQNFGKFSNPEFDRLVEQAAAMPAGSARFEVLRQAEEVLIDEEQAILPIYHYADIDLVDTDTWGGWFATTLGVHPLKDLHLK